MCYLLMVVLEQSNLETGRQTTKNSKDAEIHLDARTPVLAQGNQFPKAEPLSSAKPNLI